MEAIEKYLISLKQKAKNHPVCNELNSLISEMYFKNNWRNYQEQLESVANELNFEKPPLVLVKNNYDTCCGNKMIINQDNYQMFCELCCKVSDACPYIVINDDQLYAQREIFAKTAKFNPAKHYRQWVKYILGECPFIPYSVLEQCKNDKTIIDIRRSLKKINKSKFNKYTSAIWREVTGNKIPYVSPDVLFEGEKLFLSVLTTRDCVKGLNKNRIYYPYYIFKIWDLLLEDKSILDFIYLQSPPTLKKNDIEWQLICEKLKLKYSPTVCLTNKTR